MENLAGFDFAAYQAKRSYEHRLLRERMRDALRAGRGVREQMGTLDKVWQLGNGPFIEPYNSDPEYLADHLLCRHQGFGTKLTLVITPSPMPEYLMFPNQA